MNCNNILLIFVCFVFSNASVFSQVEYSPNQLSINASKFVLIFNEQVNNLDLTYRRSFPSSLYKLRAATTIDISTDEYAVTDFSFRLGVDRDFKINGNWKFYLGVDLNYSRTEAKSAQRINTKQGVIPFLGILYHFGTNFSISTEPSMAFFQNRTVDKDDFNPNVNSTNYTLELINIGQIKIDFHF